MYRLALKEPWKSALQKTLQQQCRRQYSKRGGLPPNVQEAGMGKALLLITPLAVVGGVVTYASYDKDFRKLVEENVPGSSTLLKYALQEEKPFKVVGEQYDSVVKSIEGATSTVSSLFGGGKESKKEEPSTQTANQAVSKTTKVEKTAPTETKKSVSAKPAPAPLGTEKHVEKLPTDVLELEKAVETAAALAVKEYNRAIGILKNFNEDVRQVVDKAVENVDNSAWNVLKNKTSARDSAVTTAEKLAREAIEKIEKCEIALSKVASASNHEQVMSIRNKVKTLVSHINNVKDELYKLKDMSTLSEKYWRSVGKARDYFIDEIEAIFPGLNLNEKKLNISKEDLDLFIMYAYSHVLAFQKELQRLQTDGEMSLKRAIEAYRGDVESEAMKAELEYQLDAEKRKLAIENQKKIFMIRADVERQLRQQLKQQAEAHVDHLNEAIALKENEMKRNYSRELEEKLAAEKANYKLQLAAMVGKMRGMDAALQARAESERSAHQAQALWAACQALWSTIRAGEPGVHWRCKLRPLRHEIEAISKVSEGDELVHVVLQNLPNEAKERGVFPEDALRERFLNVERIARKLALVPEQGASIPTYFLSFLQSIFIMRPSNPVSHDELNNKEFDYSKLDTYDILNRARYYIDHGNMMQALKYMNLLQGAPRKVANDWLKEMRLSLETQQAANTLMAHAAASGLLYL